MCSEKGRETCKVTCWSDTQAAAILGQTFWQMDYGYASVNRSTTKQGDLFYIIYFLKFYTDYLLYKYYIDNYACE